MRRYEYMTFSFPAEPPFPPTLDHAELQHLLDEWGEQGWEAVGLTTTNHRWGETREVLVLMKRELPPER